jgi:hypothetical protein
LTVLGNSTLTILLFLLSLNGFYNGLRTLVRYEDYVAEQTYKEHMKTPEGQALISKTKPVEAQPSPPLDPVLFNPYPDYSSFEYLQHNQPVERCYLDDEEKIPGLDVFSYPGVPQNMTEAFIGGQGELGLTNNHCFERFGRYGPYGYGYEPELGGLGLAKLSENQGVDKIWDMSPKVDFRNMDWGKVQQKCYEKNRIRFDSEYETPSGKKADPSKTMKARSAYLLRTWTGYEYSDYQLLALRAMINELNVKSGGEYDVHFLVHVKDDSIPIWASEDVYRETLQKALPKEFWGMATLWSEKQMEMYYPGPFTDNVFNHAKAPIHGAYRGLHLPLQWWAMQHPEYDYVWHWEMDMRLTGHYYEFHQASIEWSKKQPRKGLWERNARYYIPRAHGSYKDFTALVEQERVDAGIPPVWGPVDFPNTGMLPHPNSSVPPTTFEKDNYDWGIGEEADFIVYNPLFKPDETNWVFRDDVTGYNLSLPVPPRRTAIITVARLSRKLLTLMHEETYKMKHHMFPEMWAPSVALHHGLKAVYVPHPVYFDRDWPLDVLDQTFNHPRDKNDSPFGWGEHNQQGSSFYFNSGFSGALWRRWLGAPENNEGGYKHELGGSGRMCLLPILFHPVKHERGG